MKGARQSRARAAIACLYTDLDGTLLGAGASLFRTAEGGFTLLAARALELCYRADIEVVLMSGRKRVQVAEDARLIGQRAFIYELGGGLAVDGEDFLLVGEEWLPRSADETVFDRVAASGAPEILLDRFAGRLEPHAPWHRERRITHLFRGLVEPRAAEAALAEAGVDGLRLVDNGVLPPGECRLSLEAPAHAYHLLPKPASKATAVARHMAIRGLAREQCIAVGDSREDLAVAPLVGRFFLVRNALDEDPSLREELDRYGNVEVTAGAAGEGVYEAVVRSLSERAAPRVA